MITKHIVVIKSLRVCELESETRKVESLS